jgi:hypothetical protein
MKSFAVSAVSLAVSLSVTLMAAQVGAQTAIQPGLWESNDKSTMEGVQPMPATSRQTCLKANEAQLERLLFPTPEEIAQHGCKYQEGAKQPGVLRATLSCPPTGDIAGVDASAEINFTATSYEGLGQLVAKDKSGTSIKGSSVLSGKRIGDC